MEKVIAQIGRIGKKSQHARDFANRGAKEDVEWLQFCLEISYKRASKLLNAMANNNQSQVSQPVTVALDYRQLARYVAKRQVEGLNKYWKYPHVLKHIEEERIDENTTIELRPGYRVNK